MGLLNGTTQQQYYDGNDYGNYQFTSLDNIITQFEIAYVGENKIIPKIKRTDIAFHAQRALQELSFDTLKSIKAQEITVPATLQMVLPQDYVNYTKISWVDSAGIKHLLYPASKTSNPTNPLQNNDGEFKLQAVGTLVNTSTSITLDAEYKNVLVGMTVSSPSIPISSTITRVNNSGTTTVITITGTGATYTGNETLTFTKADGSLVLQENSAFTLTGSGIIVGSNKITAGSTSDTDQIEVGMIVSSVAFAVDTTVVDVNGVVITTSTNALTAASDPEITFTSPNSDSDTWSSYKSHTPSENNTNDYQDYQNDIYWPNEGRRYGLEPSHAQVNGSFYIDEISGKIHFSSNVSGKTVILDYISDSLGTDAEMQVHKFAEEAMYKFIAHSILSTSSLPIHQQLAPRFKKEKFAAVRQAKLRLSNVKLEELTQILRGKSKQIKH